MNLIEKKKSVNLREVFANYPVRGAERKKKERKSVESLQDLWDSIMWTTICIIAENTPNLGREIGIQSHKA